MASAQAQYTIEKLAALAIPNCPGSRRFKTYLRWRWEEQWQRLCGRANMLEPRNQAPRSFADRFNQAANCASIRDPVRHPSPLTQGTLHALLQGGEFGKVVRIVGNASAHNFAYHRTRRLSLSTHLHHQAHFAEREPESLRYPNKSQPPQVSFAELLVLVARVTRRAQQSEPCVVAHNVRRNRRAHCEFVNLHWM